MKKFLTTLLFLTSYVSFGQLAMKVNTLATLKSTVGADGMVAIMIGTNTIVDNNSGFYYWNATSTATPDDVGVIQATDSSNNPITTGRWILIRSASVKGGTYTGSGLTLTTAYVVTHGLGATPSQVFIQAISPNAAVPSWISNITSTTFTANFATVPVVGTNNLIFYWTVRL